MRLATSYRRILDLTLVICLVSLGGCAGLPRIDPSGERILIFPGETPPVAPTAPVVVAPSPADPFASVQTITPPPSNLVAPPVFRDAEPNRLCGLLPDHGLFGSGDRPSLDRVTLTPERVLAPVGSEVVLRAGVCAENGYLITNRRMEWMLGGQGVGEFVEVAEEGETDVFRWPWSRPKKVDNRYVVGLHVSVPHLLETEHRRPRR